MSCPNFDTSKLNDYKLPLVVSDDGFAYEDTIESINEFNKNTRFFEIVLESGYYVGIQANIREVGGGLYLPIEDSERISDEDANYFYGDTAENIKKELHNELAKIKDFLMGLKEQGWQELTQVCVFSNGEAIYEEVK